MKLDILSFLCSKHVSYTDREICLFFDVTNIEGSDFSLLLSKFDDSHNSVSIHEIVDTLYDIYNIYLRGSIPKTKICAVAEYMKKDDTFYILRVDKPVYVSIFQIMDVILCRNPEMYTSTPSPLSVTLRSFHQNTDDNLSYLLQRGFDVNAMDVNGNNCIMSILSNPYVFSRVQPEIVKQIIMQTRDLNVKNDDGENVLFLCVVNNLCDVFNFILSSLHHHVLIDINACVTKDNISLLNLCIVCDNFECFEALLRHDRFEIDENNNHVLFTCVVFDKKQFLEIFLSKHKYDYDTLRKCMSIGRDFNILTFVLLYEFRSYGQLFLSDKGVYAGLGQFVTNSLSVLINYYSFMEEEKLERLVLVILEAGIGTEHENVSTGNTPLIDSILQQKYSITKLLLQFNSNVNHTNKTGECALSLAVKENNTTLLRMLNMYNTNMNIHINDTDIIQYSILCNSFDSFYFLLDLVNPVYCKTCPICTVFQFQVASSHSITYNNKTTIQLFTIFVLENIFSSLIKIHYKSYKYRQLEKFFLQKNSRFISEDVLNNHLLMYLERAPEATIKELRLLKNHIIHTHYFTQNIPD